MRIISGLNRRTVGLLVAVLAILAGVFVVRERSLTGSPSDEPPVAIPRPQPVLSLIVPAYFLPTGQTLRDWDRLIAAAPRAPITAVANVASGPGEEVDPAYAAVIRRAKEAGLKVVGYVNTGYGKIDADLVRSHIRLWGEFYPEISGFFLDARAADEEFVAWYRDIREFAEQVIPGAVVITNPGILGDRAYFEPPVADVTCVFENKMGFEKLQMPSWAIPPMRRQFAAMPYQVGRADLMRTYLIQAVKAGYGTVYVTDAGGANPWHRLPIYWDDEVEAVHRLNRYQAP